MTPTTFPSSHIFRMRRAAKARAKPDLPRQVSFAGLAISPQPPPGAARSLASQSQQQEQHESLDHRLTRMTLRDSQSLPPPPPPTTPPPPSTPTRRSARLGLRAAFRTARTFGGLSPPRSPPTSPPSAPVPAPASDRNDDDDDSDDDVLGEHSPALGGGRRHQRRLSLLLRQRFNPRRPSWMASDDEEGGGPSGGANDVNQSDIDYLEGLVRAHASITSRATQAFILSADLSYLFCMVLFCSRSGIRASTI